MELLQIGERKQVLAGGDFGAAFANLAFKIGGVDFELLGEFAIDPEADMRGHGAVGPMAVGDNAEAVSRVDREGVHDVGGEAEAEAGLVIIRGRGDFDLGAAGVVEAHREGVMGGGRAELFGSEDGGADGAFGGVGVLFEEHRGHVEGVADVVETVGGLVGGEVGGGLEVDSKEVADGVVVLGLVEAAGGDATDVGADGCVLTGEFGVKPFGDGGDVGGGGLGNAGRGHFAGLEFGEGALPDFAVLSEGIGLLTGGEIDAAGGE